MVRLPLAPFSTSCLHGCNARAAACVLSGDVRRGCRPRESFLHCSVHPVPASFCIHEGQVRRRLLALSITRGGLQRNPDEQRSCLLLDHSFSTDDDNDTEVEAVDMDTELNLVTECWVEPQSGFVMNCADQHRYFQDLKYQEIPQAVCSAVGRLK